MSEPEVTVQEVYVAEFIDGLLNNRGLTDVEVARQLGYENPKVVRLMREGQVKIPLEKVPALADMVDVARDVLMNICLQEYMPGFVELFLRCYGPVSDNEVEILKVIREITGDSDPSIVGNGHVLQKLREAFATDRSA